MNYENFLSSACRSSEPRCLASQIYLIVLLFSNGWHHENLASRQLICAICEKYLEIASAHSWNIIFENFVRRTEEVAGQSVRQLKIYISRLG